MGLTLGILMRLSYICYLLSKSKSYLSREKKNINWVRNIIIYVQNTFSLFS